jgi:hypothetical protein
MVRPIGDRPAYPRSTNHYEWMHYVPAMVECNKCLGRCNDRPRDSNTFNSNGDVGKTSQGKTAMSADETRAKPIYVFRCNDSALYALTADSSGHTLPSQIYPRIRWRLERCVTLHRNHISENDKAFAATLKAIAEYGFYLTHAGSALFSLANQNPVEVGHLNGQTRDASSPCCSMSCHRQRGVG